MADFENTFSTSKAAICLRLSIGLEARSKKREKNSIRMEIIEGKMILIAE